MARAGLYKSDVKRARDALIALGRHPSLDAVRIELGNTGSKTTIHKYLRELEQEEGSTAPAASLSEELLTIVGQLVDRLQEEANVRIATAQAAADTRARQQTELAQALQAELGSAHTRAQALELRLTAEQQSMARTKEQLQQESVARLTAEQQSSHLRERLAENEEHRESLEEKHAHARDALEHYRQAAKEQRDQEQRRHEHQVQQLQAELRQLQQTLAVKQDDTTRLNQEGARLVSELAHTKQSLYEQLTHVRKLEQKVEKHQELQLHTNDMERQLAGQIAQSELMSEQLHDALVQLEPMKLKMQELTVQLAQADASIAAQEQIADQLKAYFGKIVVGPFESTPVRKTD